MEPPAQTRPTDVQVFSESANVWVPGHVLRWTGEPGSDGERLVVQYTLPGLGSCEKKVRPDSKSLLFPKKATAQEATPSGQHSAKARASLGGTPASPSPAKGRASLGGSPALPSDSGGRASLGGSPVSPSADLVIPERRQSAKVASPSDARGRASLGGSLASPSADLIKRRQSVNGAREAWSSDGHRPSDPAADGRRGSQPPKRHGSPQGPRGGPSDPVVDGRRGSQPPKRHSSAQGALGDGEVDAATMLVASDPCGDVELDAASMLVESDPRGDVEVDAAAMLVASDPRQLLEAKYGIDDSFGDDVHDAIADMPREACDLFLQDTAHSSSPLDDRAMAWALVQTNTVMQARRALPFRSVFPRLCKRMMGIGQLMALAQLLADGDIELEDYVRAEVATCEVVCIGVFAALGAKLWGQLHSSERRLVVRVLDEDIGIPTAAEAHGILVHDLSSFVVFGLIYTERQDLDAALEVLGKVEPATLEQLYSEDPEAARGALLGVLGAYRGFKESPLLGDYVEVLEPMLVKAVVERYVHDPEISIVEVCEFLVSYTSVLRAKQSPALEHLAGVPMSLLNRVLDKSVARDYEEVRHMACEAALLLLDPAKEAPIRRWANDPRVAGAGEVASLLQSWCRSYFCALVRPFMEAGLHDDGLSKEAQGLLKPGAAREPWTFLPEQSYFAASRGHTRRDADVVQLLHAFFRLVSWMGGGWQLLANFVAALDLDSPSSFGPLDSLVPRWSALRQAMTPDIARVFHNTMPASACESVFGCRSIFQEQFRKTLHGYLDRDEVNGFHGCFWELMEVVAKCLSLTRQEAVKEGIDEIKDALQEAVTRKSLSKVIRRAAALQEAKDFIEDGHGMRERSVFTLEKLRACSMRLHDVCESLASDPSPKMTNNLDSILEEILKAHPVAWLHLIINIDTILMALKYQDLEDLPTAFEKFMASSKGAADGSFAEKDFEGLLGAVRQVLRRPIVESRGNDMLSDSLDMRQMILRREESSPMTEPVTWVRGPNKVTFGPDDWKIMLQLVIAQLENMRQQLKIYLQPHHTQMITVMLFAFLVCAAKKGDQRMYKTVMAEVGTGEGKSWIIAMLAAFVAKKGLRAHVLVDNASLRQRDLAMMKDIFSSLGIKLGGADQRKAVLLDRSCRVVYCSSLDLNSMFYEATKQGRSPELDDAILIVDECDSLIIDSNPEVCWLAPDDSLSEEYKDWFAKYQGNDPDLRSVSERAMDEYTKKAFRKFRDACKQADSKVRGVDFDLIGDKPYVLDKVTKMPMRGTIPLWLDVMRARADPRHDLRPSPPQTVTSKVASYASYLHIFGLTASLGGPAERKFLREHYDAVSFKVPSYLDSCPHTAGKQRPVLKESQHMLQDGEDAQIERVVRIAVANCPNVPVLVLAENPHMRQRFLSALRDCPQLPAEFRSADCHGVQEVASDGGELVRRVELATKAVPLLADSAGSAGGRAKFWPISVSAPEGGRGHDYRVTDAQIDKHGGLLVIITFVPLSIRDWMQFTGRTARQDRRGQYAVILNAASSALQEMRNKGLKGEELVDALLKNMDDKKASVLHDFADRVAKSTLLQDLSVKFWRLKGEGALAPKEVRKWIMLVDEYMDKSAKEIQSYWDREIEPAASKRAQG